MSSLACGNRLLAQSPSAPPKKLLSLGLVTDVHHSDKATRGTRAYRDSLAKLTEACALFREQKAAALVCLGDLVDAAPTVEEELSYLKTIVPVLEKTGIPRHFVLGNHCVDTLTKEEFFKYANTTSTTGHYSFDLKGIHFVILDACYTRKMIPYGRNNSQWDDANIPPLELAWLQEDLTKNKLPTIVFTHQRLDLEPGEKHGIKQSAEVRKTLETSGRVLTVFQGHSHQNDLKTINDIPYCTLSALVEGAGAENNSYAILEIYDNQTARLKGYRKQVDRSFKA